MSIEGVAEGATLPINTLSFAVRTVAPLTLSSGEGTPDIFVTSAMGRAIRTVVLKSGGFTFTLSNAFIIGHQISTDATATPTETITISATQIVVTSPRGKNGGWDLKSNKLV